MKLSYVRLRGVRCFEDTGDINLSSKINIFVGQNNAGKSTILRGITDFQLGPLMDIADARPGSPASGVEIEVSDVTASDTMNYRPNAADRNSVKIFSALPGGSYPNQWQIDHIINNHRERVWSANWPLNFVHSFSAKRKTSSFNHSVDLGAQQQITGTFSTLYARVDSVASPGMKAHRTYAKAIEDIVGVFIGTKSSQSGKEAGYYFDDENFVTLDRMGDGVAEMVALIVDLSIAKNKLFVLEEPETNLHPKGLKALLALIRESSEHNQFIIATHSNIVVRELSEPDTNIFRVYRDGEQPSTPSKVEQVKNNPEAHRDLLRELGYEFGDFDLHESWLFLEESSAETIIRSILIPWFAPELRTRLRTFSAGGVTNLEPSVSEFQRLITFVHLEPVYKDRLWVRADGDEPGRKLVTSLREKFKYLAAPRSETFTEPQFEYYYPPRFAQEIQSALSIKDKAQRRAAKAALLSEVMRWSISNQPEAKAAWAACAAEQIELLRIISADLR